MDYFEKMRLLRLEIRYQLSQIAPKHVAIGELQRLCRMVMDRQQVRGSIMSLVNDKMVKEMANGDEKRYGYIGQLLNDQEKHALATGLQQLGIAAPDDEQHDAKAEPETQPEDTTKPLAPKMEACRKWIEINAPVTRAQIKQHMGKGTDNALQKLLDRGYVEEVGMGRTPTGGRPCMHYKVAGQVIENEDTSQFQNKDRSALKAQSKVEQVLDYITEHQPVSGAQMFKEFGAALHVYLGVLRDRGKIECVGKDGRTKIWALVGTNPETEKPTAPESEDTASEQAAEAAPEHEEELELPDIASAEESEQHEPQTLPAENIHDGEVAPDMAFQIDDDGNLVSEHKFERKVAELRAQGIIDTMLSRSECGKTIPPGLVRELKRRVSDMAQERES